MHPHDQQMFDAPGMKEIVDLLTIIRDGVLCLIDTDAWVLATPDLKTCRLAGVGTAIGPVDGLGRIVALLLGGRRDRRRLQGALAHSRAGVKLQRIRWGVDDENAVLPSPRDHLIHARHHGFHPLGCAPAPVAVPHVAEQQSRVLRRPLYRSLCDAPHRVAPLVDLEGLRAQR